MTVINQNSISGITSITAASGSVQIFNSDGSSGSLTDLAGVNVSGVVTATRYRVSAGSTAAPAITPPDDTNTGIFFPSADTIAFGEGGTEVARFDSSGRFGIGTNNPVALLHVLDSSSTTTTPLILRNYAASVNTKVRIALQGSTSGNQGASAFIQSLSGTDAGGSNSNNDSGLQFIVTNGGGATENQAMTINTQGRVGIGTASPVSALNVSVADGGNITISSTNDGHTSGLAFGDTSSNSSGRISYDHFTNAMRFDTNGSERVRLDSSGRLLVGTSSSASAGDSQYSRLQVQGNTFLATGNGILSLQRGQTSTAFGVNNTIGSVLFSDNIGGEFARIDCQADAAPGTNDYPGRLVFSTTADGASSPTERLRITNIGDLTNKTSNIGSITGTGFTLGASGYFVVTRSADCPVFINRETNDGNLIEFRQDGATEGTINVSGTTVALAGAHLSRWSQLPSGTEREEILRGTVLSNIDEMCEWGEEDNEQLNRMKVSDVEGDKNVSGVFQAWDDDDDTYTNDFYCAMTGDFIIRIGAGVTIERGDLLMSAGDGTAKPQDDDIIRSKTIAKVTSTHVTCTYDDGSYCVPCVLMAC